MIEIYIILFVLCLVISGFFSSSETAFISLQKSRLRQMVDSGVSGAEDIAELTKRPERLLTTVLIGNNFVNTAAAALGTLIIVDWVNNDNWGVLIATVSVTILLLIFSEIAPKTMATQMNERMALLYTRPLKAISWLLSPITYVLSGIVVGVSKLFGGNSMNRTLVSEDEIRAMISMGREDGAMEEGEADIMERVFLLGDLQVGEIMTPRTDIIWVEKDTPMGDFLTIYLENSHSRFPVFDETVDNVVGMLWIKDVLRALAQGNSDSNSPITELARPAYYVLETKIVGELFAEMQEQRMQVTIVVDEYGGTAGLVTMEQLLEEIVGELGDELASGRKTVETIDLNTYQVDGGMRLDQANEEIELGLPEGDYETIAGFILNALGHIPREGEQLKYADITITVTEIKGVKIEKVLITKE